MYQSELLSVFIWWLTWFMLGITSLPLCFLFFRKFFDLGFGLSKIVGVVSITYLAFIGAIFQIIPLQRTYLFVIFIIYCLVNFFIFLRVKIDFVTLIRKSIRILIVQEILFAIGFILWAWVRGYQPEINGLEKFMDFGFINSILRSSYLPPTDMWFTGNSINYYWFEHLVTALVTKLTNIPSVITYNLMLATILGLTLSSTSSIVSTLINSSGARIGIKLVMATGIISAILLGFGGNLHTPFYVLKEGADKYWYPDATRFIGYNPETEDKTIHEFPMYSFVVSDLHPHLLNLPFVFLYIALLLNYAFKWEVGNGKSFIFRLLPLSFILGIFFMTNTWDFGNYLLLSGFTFFLFNLKVKGLTLETVYKTIVTAIVIVIIGLLVALPFILHFDSIAQGVDFVRAHTPLWQLAILWGFPAILTAVFVILTQKLGDKFNVSDWFILSIIVTSWILIAIPEIIYVKDIYIASHHRANTMFKLTYQAFVMFYLTSGYIAVRTLLAFKNYLAKFFVLIFFVTLFGSILIYPNFAVNSYYRDLKNYMGLRGDVWLADRYPEEYQIVLWLNENIVGQPTILEAPGDSYTEFNVVSAYTGLPTVSGWFVHEWLWRGSANFPQERVNDITEIYTSRDLVKVKTLLNNYDVSYVIVGTFERQKYPNLNEGVFLELGELVFRTGTSSIYKII